MREIRLSGSEGGGVVLSLPLFRLLESERWLLHRPGLGLT